MCPVREPYKTLESTIGPEDMRQQQEEILPDPQRKSDDFLNHQTTGGQVAVLGIEEEGSEGLLGDNEDVC